MGTSWGGDDHHTHHDLADRDHGHGWRELQGVALDSHDHNVDDIAGAANVEHSHDMDDVRGSRVLVGQVAELEETTEALRDRVAELETDRRAMIRRMRLLEEALSLTPPADNLTADDPAPFLPTDANGRLVVELDRIDDQDPREP